MLFCRTGSSGQTTGSVAYLSNFRKYLKNGETLVVNSLTLSYIHLKIVPYANFVWQLTFPDINNDRLQLS